MLYNYANLEDAKLKALKSLESEIGTPLLALSNYEPNFARLDRAKLAKIRQAEEDLGVVLLAVKDR